MIAQDSAWNTILNQWLNELQVCLEWFMDAFMFMKDLIILMCHSPINYLPYKIATSKQLKNWSHDEKPNMPKPVNKLLQKDT